MCKYKNRTKQNTKKVINNLIITSKTLDYVFGQTNEKQSSFVFLESRESINQSSIFGQSIIDFRSNVKHQCTIFS